MKILAIDYGTRRLGLAWSDTVLDVVLPHGTIAAPRQASATKAQGVFIAGITKLLTESPVDIIVLGFPRGLAGHENQATARVKEFAFELQKHTSVPIEFFDERFTSAAADALGPGVARDEKAAMIILEGYVSSKNH